MRLFPRRAHVRLFGEPPRLDIPQVMAVGRSDFFTGAAENPRSVMFLYSSPLTVLTSSEPAN